MLTDLQDDGSVLEFLFQSPLPDVQGCHHEGRTNVVLTLQLGEAA